MWYVCPLSTYKAGANFEPLRLTVEKGLTEMVALLLEAKGIDVNQGVSVMILNHAASFP